MNISKKALLGGAAFAAILAATTSAQAFNKVDWEWNLDFYETIYKTITIDVTFDPAGIALLQFGQLQMGDVDATATMENVHNDPFLDEEVTQTVTFTGTTDAGDSLGVSGTAEGFIDIDSTGNAGTDPDQQAINGYIGIAGNPTGDSTSDGGVGLVDGALGNEAPLTVDGSTTGQLGVTVTGEVTVLAPTTLDAATELPKFENIATAVGNNASITSDRMIEFHGGQFLFDQGDGGENGGETGPSVETASLNGTGSNPYADAGTAITIAAILGVVDKADVTATANMNNVSQGQMENAATAVGNNFSATLASESEDDPADGVLMGDLTQVSVADVSSSATLSNAWVANYTNLAGIEGPLFSNVATSVGNNLSIRVDAGVAAPVVPGDPTEPGNGNE